MRTYYTVAEGQEFNYPADATSAAIIKKAGGRRKLTDADKLKVKYKTVTAGEDCSDMPAEPLALYLSRGLIIAHTEAEKVKK